MIKRLIVLSGILIQLFNIHISKAQAFSTAIHKERLIKGWQFHKGDLGGVWEGVREARPGSPQSALIWQDIELPHCFNAKDAVDPDVSYYQGPGWYRTFLDIDNPYQNGRTILQFEGAGQKTKVFIYTTKVGEHSGGYDEWKVDITKAVEAFLKSKNGQKFEGKVPLLIRCDNSRDLEMIPSDLSDFNIYGGLYRYLNLVYVPSVSIDLVKINAAVDPAGKTGTISLNASFYNPETITTGKISWRILDEEKNVVVQKEKAIQLNDGEVNTRPFKIKNPALWSPEHPALYTLDISVATPSGNHRIRQKFGFRHFEFIKNGPFKLNGKRLLIRGTHRHEDHAGVGAAMTEEVIRKEMIMIKEMGANFIRLGHYQQSRIVLDLCDSLGLLVWEEIPWCRGGLGDEKYKAQARRMLTNMISQHYNHPSIIIWGLGNENDWPGDFPSFDKQAIRTFMSELNDLSHQLDPTRKTGIRRCDFCKDIVDVYSPSIWAGWYRGKFTEYKKVSEKEMKRVNHFLHMEWGGSSHAGRHSELPQDALKGIKTGQGADERLGDALLTGGQARVSRDGDWSETYMCNLFDWTLKEQETMEWLTGAAFWIFKDFSTPIRPENPVPYMNEKGVVERDLTKKESYYVFQSYWAEKPMIHIYGHSWPVRWGNAGEQKLLKVYSNCAEVELFLNGKSLGRKKRDSQNYPAAGLHWKTSFKQGKNKVKAVGYAGDKRLTDEIAFIYQTEKWGEPYELAIEKITYDKDTATVSVKAVDKNGVLCLDAKNFIRYSLAGNGKLVDNLGTSTGSRRVQLYNGQGRIKVRLNHTENWIAINAEELKPAFANLCEPSETTSE